MEVKGGRAMIVVASASKRNVKVGVARKIMGDRMSGPEVVMRCFGVHYKPKHLEKLEKVPFSEEFLISCRDRYVLFPGFQLTVMEVINRVFGLPGNKLWFANHGFASKRKVLPRWYLLGTKVMGLGLNFQDQKKMLGQDEEIPLTCEAIFASALWICSKGEHLFPLHFRIRCGDDFNGNCAYVEFLPHGISVGLEPNYIESDNLGFISKKKKS